MCNTCDKGGELFFCNRITGYGKAQEGTKEKGKHLKHAIDHIHNVAILFYLILG